MKNNEINFTIKTLNELPNAPEGKRVSYHDKRVSSLRLEVTSKGKKTFKVYRKLKSQPIRYTIGNLEDWTIENARAEAETISAQIAKGINPNAEKNKLRSETTFEKLFNKYMNEYAKIHKKTYKRDGEEVQRYLKHWLKLKISSIDKQKVFSLHQRIGKENGQYAANKILALIQVIFNKAIEWGWDGKNPAHGIKKFKEKSRDRYITPAELPLFMNALSIEENETARDYFYIALYTGARKTNTLQMRWEQIDWHNKTWRIPDTKNGEPITLPLTTKAEEILDSRLKASHGNPWVFPSDTSKDGYYSDPKKAWNRVRQRATLELWKQNPVIAKLIEETESKLTKANNYGYTVLKLFNTVQKETKERDTELPTGLMDIRLHDIRRTFGSYQAMSGASLQIIGKSLGHKSQQSTQIYARLHNDPVKASMEKATNAMLAFAEGK